MWQGLVLQGAGNVAEGIGNGQGANAVRGVWDDALRRQRGFDNTIDAQTLSFLSQLNPDLLMGTNRSNDRAVKLDSATSTASKAIASKQAKGGRNALPPGGGQKLADLLRSVRVGGDRDARLSGAGGAANDIGLIANQFAGDRNRTVRDAQLWSGLVPSQLAAAGHQGGAWRGLGQTAQTFGQGLINWQMAQPQGGAGAPNQLASTPGAGGVQPAMPQWQQPAQWRMGQSMQPQTFELFPGGR